MIIENFGSVCSGGRYENLAQYYTDKKLPGVGISIGLTRLFYKLNELNLINANKKSVSDVLIIPMVEDLKMPIEIATNLRKNGINTEIYLNNKKLKAKFKYANKLEIPNVVIIGEDELKENKVKVKDMETGRVYISSQNHGYAVNPESLDPKVAVPAFTNVNDGTNEGLKYVGKNIFTVQYHPEACPGPQDSSYLFDRFLKMMEEKKNA